MLNCPDCLHFWYPNVGLERRASTKHALATAEILVTVGKRYFSKISSLKYRTTQYSKNLELVLGFSGFYRFFICSFFSADSKSRSADYDFLPCHFPDALLPALHATKLGVP